MVKVNIKRVFILISATLLLLYPNRFASPKQATWRDKKELACLATILWYEGRGEPIKGQKAILQVVENRMKTRKLSACQVMKEKKQFSFYKPGLKYKLTRDMLITFDKADTLAPTKCAAKAEYYHNTTVKPEWASKMQRLCKIDNHIFYKEKK